MQPSAIRDSSLDYRTYWLQGGQYYSRRGLGEAAPACDLPIDKLRQIPEGDRKVLIDEVNADAAFCRKVAKCMATNPNWGHVIAASAKEAVVNEMDPTRFKNRAGMWPKLRERARTLIEEVGRMAAQGKVPVAVKANGKPMAGLGDLGQWDIIASLVGSIGSAAANVYGSSITARTQEQIAKTQAEAAMKAANAQIAMQNAQAAILNAQGSQSPISAAVTSLTSTTVAGIPLLALAVPAVGLIIYFATKK